MGFIVLNCSMEEFDLLGIHHDFQIARLEFFHAAIEYDAAPIDKHEIREDVLNLFHLMCGHHDSSAAIAVVVQQRIENCLRYKMSRPAVGSPTTGNLASRA